jgi:hypothetical protein
VVDEVVGHVEVRVLVVLEHVEDEFTGGPDGNVLV